MKLTEEVKEKIKTENKLWVNAYGNKTMEERKKLGAFYTPADLIIEMIECLDKIDPDEDYEDCCAGSGNILAALMIAGVEPEHIFCNELDEDTLSIAHNRLNELSMKLYGRMIPLSHFRHEDALEEKAYFTDITEPKKTFLDKFGDVE